MTTPNKFLAVFLILSLLVNLFTITYISSVTSIGEESEKRESDIEENRRVIGVLEEENGRLLRDRIVYERRLEELSRQRHEVVIKYIEKPAVQLSSQEEDTLFSNLGIRSERRDEGGRYVFNEGVVAIQQLVQDKAQCKEELAICDAQVNEQKSLIALYIDSEKNTELQIQYYKNNEVLYNDTILQLRREAAKEKASKWLIVVGSVLLAGAAATSK